VEAPAARPARGRRWGRQVRLGRPEPGWHRQLAGRAPQRAHARARPRGDRGDGPAWCRGRCGWRSWRGGGTAASPIRTWAKSKS